MMSKWNFEKNEKLGLFPDKLTCGSNKWHGGHAIKTKGMFFLLKFVISLKGELFVRYVLTKKFWSA